MGVIEDGKISGTIPNNNAFAVNLPAYFSSTSRAVHCLGGTQAILNARGSPSNKLDFHFRPEDPYSHPVSGVLRPSNKFLLKISANNGIEKPPCADIVACVPECYHFEGMADYQYVVAVHAENARKKRSWSEIDEVNCGKDKLRDLVQDDLMILLPPFFSAKDMPENLVLRPPAPNSSKKKEEDAFENHFEMNIEPGLAIDFNVKEIPKEGNWKEFLKEGSELWKGQLAVSELFEERPIWPKCSLVERLLDKDLKFNIPVLKRLLLSVAYYFSSGPFKLFWIRKGYDPRKDPDSRIYQRMDFRVPPQLRSYCDANVNSLKHRWEDLCKFRVFPVKCQTSFQLYELDDEFIHEEIRKPSAQPNCSYSTGWFSQQMLECLRLRVMVKFLSVYPESGAEKLLKVASEEFQKSKKACAFKDVLKPVQEENQQTERDVASDPARNVEAEENDSEEHEAEMDDEAPDSAEEEGDTFPQDLHMRNNSRSYLQDLFDSFPPAEAGAGDANSGDEEYQIYEQYNDDEYTDYEDD